MTSRVSPATRVADPLCFQSDARSAPVLPSGAVNSTHPASFSSALAMIVKSPGISAETASVRPWRDVVEPERAVAVGRRARRR